MMLELESLLEIDARFTESTEYLLGYPSITPIDRGLYRTRMSSAFGMRDDPLNPSRRKMHEGNDWAAAKGTPVRATADGIVVDRETRYTSSSRVGFGNYVRIQHASGLQTFYGHLDRLHPRAGSGARIKRGEVIGYVGRTGRSNGYHLHYAVINRNGQELNPWYYYFEDRKNQALGISLR
jgi:murein DD-endopeptidase MepM/ murein hydrolase activator NlpD